MSGAQSMLTAALAYAERGWPVFPCHWIEVDAGCSCRQPTCKSPGKHPRTEHGLKDASSDRQQVERWWRASPIANIGIVTGAQSGLVVLDVDPPEGDAQLARVVAHHGPIPATLTAKSGKSGRHYYFAHPGGAVPNGQDLLGEKASGAVGGLDARGDGGYIIAPPSRNEAGVYEWLTPNDVPPAELPSYLLPVIAGRSELRRARSQPDRSTHASEGHQKSQHTAVRDLSWRLVQGGVRDAVPLRAAITAANERDVADHGARRLGADEVDRMIAGALAKQSPGEWLPLVSLDDPDPVPFPADVLPPWLRGWAEAVAEALQVPVDFPAMLGLALVAGAAGGCLRVQVLETWAEPLNLYVVIVGPPSAKKSPTFSYAMQPLIARENQVQEMRAPAIREATVDKRLKLARLAKAEKDAAKAGNPEEAAQLDARVLDLQREADAVVVPARPRLYESNVTPEALISALFAQDGRLVAMSAEGGDFLEVAAGLRYGDSGPNLEALLKAWCGDLIRVARKNRPEEDIPHPALTIAIAVQPSVIRKLASQDGVRERGLPARFLYAIPNVNQGNRKPLGQRVALDEATQRRYVGRMLGVWERFGPGSKREPGRLTLSPGAFGVLCEFDAAHERRLHPLTGDLAWVDDCAGKLTGTVARLAGVLHVADSAPGQDLIDTVIPAATVERAVRLADPYLIGHATIAFGEMGASPARDLALRIVRHVERTGETMVSRADLYRATRRRGGVKSPEDLEPALKLLVEHGYARFIPRPGRTEGVLGRTPADVYEFRNLSTKSTKPANVVDSVDSVDSSLGGEVACAGFQRRTEGTYEPAA